MVVEANGPLGLELALGSERNGRPSSGMLMLVLCAESVAAVAVEEAEDIGCPFLSVVRNVMVDGEQYKSQV